MTLNQFKGLDEETQIRTLWQKGVHVATNDNALYQYLLYQLDGFYVEVSYHISMETFHSFWSFSDTRYLDPYLQQINIEPLCRS